MLLSIIPISVLLKVKLELAITLIQVVYVHFLLVIAVAFKLCLMHVCDV